MAATPLSTSAGTTHACGACEPPRARGDRGRALSFWSAALLVVMPKCPFCLVAWAGALGLGGYASQAMMIPTAVLVLFCASQAVFFVTARRTGERRALVAAGLGVTLVLTGALLDLGLAVRFAGVALLVVASVLNALATARARLAAPEPAQT